MKCDVCESASKCLDHIEIPTLSGCTSGIPTRKVLANADRIRSMSDEELAEFLAEHDLSLDDNNLPMPNDWLEWLQSPVDEVSDIENLKVRR